MGSDPPQSGTLPLNVLDAAVELLGRTGRGGTVRVQGRSMEPMLREGQVLAVNFAPAPPRRGALLLFRQQDYLVVHRYVGPGRVRDGLRYLRTRGDGMPDLDPAVDPARVLGRVVAARYDDGWRSLRGAGSRRYAACLAWHDLSWAAFAALARASDRALERLGARKRLHYWVASVDRWLLRRVHRFLFARLHPLSGQPFEAGEDGSA